MRNQFRCKAETYFCPGCCVTGRLPVVVGEGFCSHCGELVWTVKAQVRQTEFGPDYRLPIRLHRLPLRLRARWFARLCIRLFPSLAHRVLLLREQRSKVEINETFERLRDCQDRDEYERLLGPPKELLSGKGIGTLRNGRICDSPDVIQHHELTYSCFDLFFKDDRLQSQTAYEKPTALRLEYDLANDSRRANTARPQRGVTV